jgi:hypothetical protein
MSIAANVPLVILKLRRSGIFVQRSWKAAFRFRACFGTMNLKPRIPKGFRLKAQGCRALASPARTEATLGLRYR